MATLPAAMRIAMVGEPTRDGDVAVEGQRDRCALLGQNTAAGSKLMALGVVQTPPRRVNTHATPAVPTPNRSDGLSPEPTQDGRVASDTR